MFQIQNLHGSPNGLNITKSITNLHKKIQTADPYLHITPTPNDMYKYSTSFNKQPKNFQTVKPYLHITLHQITRINIQRYLTSKLNPLNPQNFKRWSLTSTSPLHQIAHIHIQHHLTCKLNVLPTDKIFKCWSLTSTSPHTPNNMYKYSTSFNKEQYNFFFRLTSSLPSSR
jgi:hypothetical protein